MVFAPFWPENGYRLFGLESGVVFKGTTGVYERIYSFNSKMRKNEREICEFEIDFKKSFFVAVLIEVIMT